MFNVHRLNRSAALCALVCAALMTMAAGVAVGATDSLADHGLHAQEDYYASFGSRDTSAALAQEQYLGSYGEPQPLGPSQPATPSDDTPWLPIALAITGALVVAASATQLRRLRIRRRRAAGHPA
jgi:hypothetical protein